MSDPDLARRLVACPRFRFMPRMLDIYGRQIIRVDGGKLTVAWCGNPHHRLAPDITVAHPADFPLDLDDPATKGCVEALVQQALGHDGVNVVVEVRWTPYGYHVQRWSHDGARWTATVPENMAGHPTKIAALVAALEAAP